MQLTTPSQKLQFLVDHLKLDMKKLKFNSEVSNVNSF